MIEKLDPSSDLSHREELGPALLDLWNDEKSLPFLSFTLRPFTEETIAGWLEHHWEAGIEYFVFRQEPGRRIEGVAVLKMDSVLGLELLGLVVHPRSRSCGVGSALAESVHSLAKHEGFRSITASVFADNKKMLRLMLALDYVPTGMKYHKRADGADLLVLSKRV